MFFKTPIFDINNIFCQPFNPTDIEYYQNNDKPLKKQCKDNPEEYQTVQIDKAIIVVRLAQDQQLSTDNPDYDIYMDLSANLPHINQCSMIPGEAQQDLQNNIMKEGNRRNS